MRFPSGCGLLPAAGAVFRASQAHPATDSVYDFYCSHLHIGTSRVQGIQWGTGHRGTSNCLKIFLGSDHLHIRDWKLEQPPLQVHSTQ